MGIDDISEVLRRKALKSGCSFRVSAIAFSRKGNVLGIAGNAPRFARKSGGRHAERILMMKFGPAISQIFICRVNRTGELLPIDPCPTCMGIARKLGIRIRSVS